jgi:hypothetical protein
VDAHASDVRCAERFGDKRNSKVGAHQSQRRRNLTCILNQPWVETMLRTKGKRVSPEGWSTLIRNKNERLFTAVAKRHFLRQSRGLGGHEYKPIINDGRAFKLVLNRGAHESCIDPTASQRFGLLGGRHISQAYLHRRGDMPQTRHQTWHQLKRVKAESDS